MSDPPYLDANDLIHTPPAWPVSIEKVFPLEREHVSRVNTGSMAEANEGIEFYPKTTRYTPDEVCKKARCLSTNLGSNSKNVIHAFYLSFLSII